MSTVNNLNIFTFIKDIYQSLKNIDKILNLNSDDLNKRINKLEDNQQILIDKLTNIEVLLNSFGEMNKSNNSLDKNIEFELLEKMKKLNQNEVNNSKLSLKPEELTFANILENNYQFSDINESMGNISISNSDSNSNSNNNSENVVRFDTYDNAYSNLYNNIEDILENDIKRNNEILDKLLF